MLTCVHAGIIFSEALLHGTLPWTHPTKERRSLLYRYAGKETNYNAGVYTATQLLWPDGTVWERRVDGCAVVLDGGELYSAGFIEELGGDQGLGVAVGE